MAQAKDIMTTDVVTVRAETSIQEALDLLARHNITGIPVVDGRDEVVGILSEKDVLCLMHQKETVFDKTVSDYMTVPAITFDSDESIHDICECLATYHFRRVPVTEKGRIIGIVSRKDILEYIIKHRFAMAGHGSVG